MSAMSSEAESNKSERLPGLLVIGAAKSGTTALYHQLREHPRLYLPPHQEPSFFAFEGKSFEFAGPPGIRVADNAYPITDRTEYLSLYADAGAEILRADVSPAYLYWPGTAGRIARHAPHAKLVAILRNPADRAYSAYLHARREDREPIHDFAAAVDAEPQRVADNWGLIWRYIDQGFYARQLDPYYELFQPEKIKVFLYEDFVADAQRVCEEIARFADVGPMPPLDTSVRYNVSGLPKSRVLHQALSSAPVLAAGRVMRSFVGEQRLRRTQARLSARNAQPPPPLDADTRRTLIERFAEDIARLEKLIDRDLAAWLR